MDFFTFAYNLNVQQKALALDGTFYQKSGIISGGSHDLARKAKRWDEKHMAQLKSQKEKLAEDLKELVKKSRKGSELATVESQIKVRHFSEIAKIILFTIENTYLPQGLENRLKYSQKDLETSKKSIATFEKKLQELEAELNGVAVSTPTLCSSTGLLIEIDYVLFIILVCSQISAQSNAACNSETRKFRKSSKK